MRRLSDGSMNLICLGSWRLRSCSMRPGWRPTIFGQLIIMAGIKNLTLTSIEGKMFLMVSWCWLRCLVR